MASIELRGDSFRIVFRFGGQKFSRSLKTQHKGTAQASLARLEDNLRRIELGTLTVPDTIDIATFLLSDGHMIAKSQAPVVRSLGQLLDRYLASVPADSVEDTTLRCLRIHTAHLKRLLGRNLSLPTLGLEQVQAYVNARVGEDGLRGQKVRSTTVKKEIATLSAAWNWGLAANLVQRPFLKRGLKYPKSTEKLVFQTLAEVERRIKRGGLTVAQETELWDSVFLSLGEVDELLRLVEKKATTPFVYPMMVFAAHTGARRSEIVRCQVDDIDLAAKVATIHEKKRIRGRLTTRRVPLSPLLARVLNAWLANHPGSGQLFYSATDSGGTDSPLTPKETYYQFKKAVEGTRWEKLRGWHAFRHSFCSNCAARGIDQRIINGWVPANAVTTRHKCWNSHEPSSLRARRKNRLPKNGKRVILGIGSVLLYPASSQGGFSNHRE